MNIQITSRKFRAKESLKEQVKSELKSLEKIYDDILDANVILSYTHPKDSIKTVEIQLQIPGKILTASESTDDFRKSLTAVVNKLERQLIKHKTKKMAKVKQ